jgi:hypothetical protein
MTNPSKAKGTAFESSIVGYLRDTGWPYAERRALHGGADEGDVTGIPGVVVECKAGARSDLSGWLRELAVEVGHAKADIGVLVVKRKGVADPARQYAVMEFGAWCELLAEADR